MNKLALVIWLVQALVIQASVGSERDGAQNDDRAMGRLAFKDMSVGASSQLKQRLDKTDAYGNYKCRNCVGCTNCSGCMNCKNCSSCTGCSNCEGCSNSNGCMQCNRCVNCNGCMNCSNLSNANGQMGLHSSAPAPSDNFGSDSRPEYVDESRNYNWQSGNMPDESTTDQPIDTINQNNNSNNQVTINSNNRVISNSNRVINTNNRVINRDTSKDGGYDDGQIKISDSGEVNL